MSILPYQALSRRVSTKNVNVSELVYVVPRSLYLEWCKRFGSDGLPARNVTRDSSFDAPG